MSRARDLSKLGNPNVIVADTERVGFGTQVPENAANASSSLISAGIVTATAFYGDGSNLEGVASAGLGTAVDDTKDSIGQNIYFTNAELSINENTTVNAPDTSNIAYTQYQQVTVESGSELIISDGDSFIPDVLGIGTALQASTAGAGNGLFGTVYVDNIENVAGRGGPHFPLGITVAGVSTLSGNVSIGGTLTYEDVTNVDSIGVVTARNGIDITGGDLNAASNLIVKTGGTELVRINATNVTIKNPSAAWNTIQRAAATDYAGVRIQDADNTNRMQFGVAGASNQILSGAAQHDVCLKAYDANLILGTNNTERLRIGSAGQIGLSGANYGTSGQVLTSQGGSAAPQWGDVAAGMSEYDVWAMTNNTGASEWDYEVIGGGSAPQSITIARQTTTQNPLFTKIGTGMSYASGIWTFPSTGHWECIFTHIVQTQTAGTGQQYYMDVTQDNGTSWSPITFIFNTIGQGYGHTQTLIYNFLNVTNVGQQKVRYRWKSDGPCYSKGSTSDLRSSFVWKKVA